MNIILHDYWRSSASYRVRIALGLKGIPYQHQFVNLVSGEQRNNSHLALNPQGLVPVLEVDGLVLTQSLAIIEYLDETRPGPKLLPESAAARAYVRALSLAIACEVHPVSNLRVLTRIEEVSDAEKRAAWNRDNIAEGLAAFERLLDSPFFSGKFCCGDSPTMADCTLVPQLYNARRWGVGTDQFARISCVAQYCAELPAFEAASPENVLKRSTGFSQT
jgi:maleylacetoacetate isomerase